MFAKFSPDGTRVGYVRAQNVYVETLATGAITQLTTDGGGDITNGTSDWVNEEEFSIRDGFRWSPDSRAIAYWQFDTTGVERFTLINDTDALYPTIKQYPYPKPGTTNSAVRVGIVPAAGGTTTWVKTPGALRDFYIPRMDWADAATLILQHMNRLQNTNDVLLADAGTGETRRVLRDQSKAWVEENDAIEWISGGREFIWISEKDGWRHAYAVARDGSHERAPDDLRRRHRGDRCGRRCGGAALFHGLAGKCDRALSVRRRARRPVHPCGASRRPTSLAPTATTFRQTAAGRSTRGPASTCRQRPRSSACRTTAPSACWWTMPRWPRRSRRCSSRRSSS